MKNLGKAIDHIIKIDPSLQEKLILIKNKWKKYPSKAVNYWQELLDYLNNNQILNAEKKNEIKNYLTKKTRKKTPLYSFEEIIDSDKILGVIPENIADKIRRHDRRAIEIAKMKIEAEITKDQKLRSFVTKNEDLLDINSKKIWVELKDNFQLWDRATSNLQIKKNKGILILVETVSFLELKPGIIKMNETTLRQILQYLGYNLGPSENQPPSSNEND